MSDARLCDLADIPDGGARGFEAALGEREVSVLAVRKGSDVFVYENECPHVGTPLNFMPDEFLDDDGEMIQCATHMAMFRIEDGLCTEGPCEGDHLTALPADVRDGAVYIRAGG